MSLYTFTVHLDRSPTDDEIDRLYDAGLDDCTPVCSPTGHGRLMVAREADSMTQAILTVVAEISEAGLNAVGIDSDDLVTITVIGERTNRTRESARLLASSQRGPGGFPPPVSDGKIPLYSWASVREWFRTHYGDQSVAPADHDADTLAAADLLLRARLLTNDMSELSTLVTA